MKPIRLGVLMDDISSIKPNKDSTFAMMLEAQKRGWEIHTFDNTDMFYADGLVSAHSKRTTVIDLEINWYKSEASKVINLGSLDVVFMRKDPPFDMDYIYATYLLEQAEIDGVIVVNKPSSLRDANEKLFALNFPDYIPETLVSSNIEQLIAFINDNEEAIVKPLDGMGGKDIYKLKADDENINEVLLEITNQGQRYIMAQKFLPEIVHGDKRILLITYLKHL